MHLYFFVVAGLLATSHAQTNSACSSGIYSALSPLSTLPAIQSYCSFNYPPTPVTVADSTSTKTTVAGTSTVTQTSTVTESATSTQTNSVRSYTDAPNGYNTKRDLQCRAQASSSPSAKASCNNGPVKGSTCSVSCGIDRPGGDYANKRVNSFQECIKACEADTRCVTARYHIDNGYCYFKNTVNAAVSDKNVDFS